MAVLTVLALGAGSFLLGTGTVNQALQLLDGGVWVSDGASGTATRVNIAAAQADLAYQVVPDGVEVVEVVNVDGDLVAIGSDGVARIVGAAEGPQNATEVPLNGAQVYAGLDWVFLVDKAAGTVTARSLEHGRIGDPQPTTLDAPLGAVAVGPSDTLHAVLKGKDQVAVVKPGASTLEISLPHADSALLAPHGSGVAAVDAGRGVVTDLSTGKTKSMPRITGTVQAVSASDGWVVAVGGTRLVGVDLRDGRTTQVDLGVQAAAPPAGSGSSIVSVLGSHAYVVAADGKARQISLAEGRLLGSIGIDGGHVRETVTAAAGIVLNDPAGTAATVIGKNGKPKPVNKANAAATGQNTNQPPRNQQQISPANNGVNGTGVSAPQSTTPPVSSDPSVCGGYPPETPLSCYSSIESVASGINVASDNFGTMNISWPSATSSTVQFAGRAVWIARSELFDPATGRIWNQGTNDVPSPGTYCVQVRFILSEFFAVGDKFRGTNPWSNTTWTSPQQHCLEMKSQYRSIGSVTAYDSTPDSPGPTHTIVLGWFFADDGDLAPSVHVTGACAGSYVGLGVTCEMPVGATYSVRIETTVPYSAAVTSITVPAPPPPVPVP